MSESGLAELGSGDRLLLLCAHLELAPAQQGELRRLVVADLDWDDVVRRAEAHQIHPHLYHHLHALGVQDLVPPDLWSHLHQTSAFAAARNMAQRAEAGRVLRALDATGIEVIPLKALALWHSVYPNPVLRLSADLDLLVRPGSVAEAARCLDDLGYVQGDGVAPRDEYRPAQMHHLLPFGLPGRPVFIEIHWDLAPPWHGYRIDVDGLWRRSVPGAVAGCPVRFLSPEDTLLHLCVHTASGSRFLYGLRHLIDVAETVRICSSSSHPGIDWQLLAGRADAWGVRSLVYLALRVSDDLLGLGGAHDHLAVLQPASFPPNLVDAARRRVLDIAPGMPDSMVHPTADGLFRSLHSAPLAARLRLLARLLFLPRAEMAVRHRVPATSPRLLAGYLQQPLNVMRRRLGAVAHTLVQPHPSLPTPPDHDEEQVLLDYWLRWQRLPIS